MMISVCICTKNRPQELKRCIQYLRKNTFRNSEIVVIDQSDPRISRLNAALCVRNKAKYVYNSARGQASSRNLAIRKASGDIISFTDDDCIVHSKWLSVIHRYFYHHPGTEGVFGNVLPYLPRNHLGLTCPSALAIDHDKTVTNPYEHHYQTLGLGNNMSFRRALFTKYGLFNEWLGAGSVSDNGSDDMEFIHRVLLHKAKLVHVASAVVYHNRWLTRDQDNVLNVHYKTGNCAFYTRYFCTTGNWYYVKKIWEQVLDNITQIGNASVRRLPDAKVNLLNLKAIVKGIVIGLFIMKNNKTGL